MSIKNVLNKSAQKLKQNGIKNPHLEAEFLLSFILNKSREYLLAHPEKEITKFQIANYQLQITRRLKGIPIAYLVGKKRFYDLDFYVNKNVLIPRPETELIVEEACHIINNIKPETIIDVGTGSGCIIITLAKLLNKKYPISNIRYFALDISKSALNVARKNAQLHKVDKKIKFLNGDLLQPVLKNLTPSTHYLITANLPYLIPKQVKNSFTIKYEPKIALLAGQNGLKYYKKLFRQINIFGSLLGVHCSLLCEIDPSQIQKIKEIIKKNLPKAEIKIKKDLAKKNRLAIVKIN